MEKPKKKERKDWHCLLQENDNPITKDRNFNAAHDEWTVWLLSKECREEIKEAATVVLYRYIPSDEILDWLTQTISERLGKG